MFHSVWFLRLHRDFRHFIRVLQRLGDRVLGCMFAVVTAGKQLIRGSERIVVFRAIADQTNRSSVFLSQHKHFKQQIPHFQNFLNRVKTTHNATSGARRHVEEGESIFSPSDLLIPAPPGSIWLLLAALMGLRSINPRDYLAATDTWGQDSWTSSAGW